MYSHDTRHKFIVIYDVYLVRTEFQDQHRPESDHKNPHGDNGQTTEKQRCLGGLKKAEGEKCPH